MKLILENPNMFILDICDVNGVNIERGGGMHHPEYNHIHISECSYIPHPLGQGRVADGPCRWSLPMVLADGPWGDSLGGE